MAATLHDVAKLAGVSIKTVSNVVNDYVHVSPETRRRVRWAIDEVGYQPNLSARSLRSGRSGAISLVVPELGLSYFAQLADAVIERADSHGLIVQVEQTNGDRDREIAMLSSPWRQLADGLLFSPLGMSRDDAELLTGGYPVVILGEQVFGPSVDHVAMRNVEAARAAAQLLVDAGRRRIAVVGAHEHEVGALRVEGYRQALRAAGLEPDPDLVVHTAQWHRADGVEAVTRLLSSGVHVDGVFALNDALALGTMRGLQHAGRRVPDDVALVGFDNIEESRYSLPALTTVEPGRDLIARRGVDLLVERISGSARPEAAADVLVDFELVLRESH